MLREPKLSRWCWILGLAAAWCSLAAPRQATGVKVGEVTHESAIVWMRLTRDSERNWKGLDLRGKGGQKTVPEGISPDELEGAAPGAAGRVRLRYGTQRDLSDARQTPWVTVSAVTDYAHQFVLRGLRPDTVYYFAAETADLGDGSRHESLFGEFRTAPLPTATDPILFTAITCLMYADLDDRDGFKIFDAMLELRPRFTVFTGDDVYYDNEDPRVTSVAVAKYHWQRMYSLPRHVRFCLRVPTYWMKDDHDTYADDCWPGMKLDKMGSFTFEDGQRIFLEQVPMGERTWRRFRWGKHLEIWLVEGRDFRSPNPVPDGPDKTIWGRAQKDWLKKTLLSSDATWRILISPTPLVGPDRKNKADNHSNAAFAHEGREMRQWLADHLKGNVFVICGDRHWQYHSVDPETGLHEFCTGAVSDEHAGGSPGEDPRYHRFHRVKGGFLSVLASGEEIRFRHHDVNGRVVYEYRQAAPRRTLRP